MKTAVLGATFRTAWVDAWEAIAYGWAFFRREWRALLWAYLPLFILLALLEVGQAYEDTLVARERTFDLATNGGLDAFYISMYLHLAVFLLLIGFLSPLYSYVAEQVKSGDTVARPVSFLPNWRRYIFSFTVLWLITLLPRLLLYSLLWHVDRSRTTIPGTPDLYSLAVPAIYLFFAPFLAPLLFVLVMDGKGILRALRATARLFARNYVALVVLIATMYVCISGADTVQDMTLGGLADWSANLPKATGLFDPNAFLIGVRSAFIRHLQYGPVMPDTYMSGTPVRAVAERIFRARLLPQGESSSYYSTDSPARQNTLLAYTVLTWLVILVMFFIYVPAMFYWVKKRLPVEAPTTATPPLEVPAPTPLPPTP